MNSSMFRLSRFSLAILRIAPGSRLIRNLCLDEFRQQRKRLLPAKIASFSGNHSRHPFLRDVQLSSDGYLLQADRHLHFSGQVRVIELIGVTDELMRPQLEIAPAEGVALAAGEIGEGHFVSPADFRFQVMNLARKPVRRKPLDHCVSINEGSINSLGLCAKNSV